MPIRVYEDVVVIETQRWGGKMQNPSLAQGSCCAHVLLLLIRTY